MLSKVTGNESKVTCGSLLTLLYNFNSWRMCTCMYSIVCKVERRKREYSGILIAYYKCGALTHLPYSTGNISNIKSNPM